MKDVVGTSIWDHLLRVKQYNPQNLVHTGCRILDNNKTGNQQITTSLIYEETGARDTLGGIISNKIYTDAENYYILPIF